MGSLLCQLEKRLIEPFGDDDRAPVLQAPFESPPASLGVTDKKLNRKR